MCHLSNNAEIKVGPNQGNDRISANFDTIFVIKNTSFGI